MIMFPVIFTAYWALKSKYVHDTILNRKLITALIFSVFLWFYRSCI